MLEEAATVLAKIHVRWGDPPRVDLTTCGEDAQEYNENVAELIEMLLPGHGFILLASKRIGRNENHGSVTSNMSDQEILNAVTGLIKKMESEYDG